MPNLHRLMKILHRKCLIRLLVEYLDSELEIEKIDDFFDRDKVMRILTSYTVIFDIMEYRLYDQR